MCHVESRVNCRYSKICFFDLQKKSFKFSACPSVQLSYIYTLQYLCHNALARLLYICIFCFCFFFRFIFCAFTTALLIEFSRTKWMSMHRWMLMHNLSQCFFFFLRYFYYFLHTRTRVWPIFFMCSAKNHSFTVKFILYFLFSII